HSSSPSNLKGNVEHSVFRRELDEWLELDCKKPTGTEESHPGETLVRRPRATPQSVVA
ncbi:unnamed protein product, partial [Scytosiphon promiscuus]